MIPYRIYLSGGGICAIGHVGALVELANHIPLKAVKEWMGVSAGSLVAMCLSIGFTLDELYDICIRFDFWLLFCVFIIFMRIIHLRY
jgi:predicted acylesterase/phospholipase RssA